MLAQMALQLLADLPYTFIKKYLETLTRLNIIGKKNSLHKIESIITFVNLHDEILIKKINLKKHVISFSGKFSKNIGKNNTIFELLRILEEKKILNNQKFKIKVKKRIPNKAGLGGGSMNAASVLKFLIKKKIINVTKKGITEISRLVGSDVILGLNQKSASLNSKNQIQYFKNITKFHTLIVKPNFGC